MNKQELVSSIALRSDLTRVAVELALNALADVVRNELSNQREVLLPGLGKLKSSYRPQRAGRNPATGQPMRIEGKHAPKFTAIKALKDAIN